MSGFFKTHAEFEQLDAWRARVVRQAGGAARIWPTLRSFMFREFGPAEESILPLAPLADTGGRTALPPHALTRSTELLLEIIARQPAFPSAGLSGGETTELPCPGDSESLPGGIPGSDSNLGLADIRSFGLIWNGHQPFRKRPASNWITGAGAEDPEWVERFLDNTLEWFAGGVVNTLHPVEQASLMTLRLADMLPFAGWNFYLVRIVAWFYLLRAGFPPPLFSPGELPPWFEAVRAGHGGETIGLSRLYQRLAEQSCRRLAPEDS